MALFARVRLVRGVDVAATYVRVRAPQRSSSTTPPPKFGSFAAAWLRPSSRPSAATSPSRPPAATSDPFRPQPPSAPQAPRPQRSLFSADAMRQAIEGAREAALREQQAAREAAAAERRRLLGDAAVARAETTKVVATQNAEHPPGYRLSFAEMFRRSALGSVPTLKNIPVYGREVMRRRGRRGNLKYFDVGLKLPIIAVVPPNAVRVHNSRAHLRLHAAESTEQFLGERPITLLQGRALFVEYEKPPQKASRAPVEPKAPVN